MALAGLHGHPWIDLASLLPEQVAALPVLHEEICLGLTAVQTTYTGGSHRSLGICPPGWSDDRPDYGEVIASLTDREYLVLCSLGDPHAPMDPRDRDVVVGEDGDVALSWRQQRWLELRYGVYFPWKVYLELMPGGAWDTKADPRGKRFTREAMLHFPRTVQVVRSLPFAHIGSVKILGLLAGDDGTVHRDGDPATQQGYDHFVTLAPTSDKRLFLWDAETDERVYPRSRAYWFNDHDWHGVEADPVFRYSVRVDGVFREDFLQRIVEVC